MASLWNQGVQESKANWANSSASGKAGSIAGGVQALSSIVSSSVGLAKGNKAALDEVKNEAKGLNQQMVGSGSLDDIYNTAVSYKPLNTHHTWQDFFADGGQMNGLEDYPEYYPEYYYDYPYDDYSYLQSPYSYGAGGKIASAGLSNTANGAMAGMKIGGPWGAVIGGAVGLVGTAVGSLFGHSKAKKMARQANEAAEEANNGMQFKINSAIEDNAHNTLQNYENAQPYAFGGLLGDMGAVNYGLASDYLTIKDKQASNKQTPLSYLGNSYIKEKPVTVFDENNSFENGGGISIKKNRAGLFTQQAEKEGMSVQEFASHVLANKDRYPASTVRRAVFARNASNWNKDGRKPTRYALGGDMQTNGSDFTDGLTEVNAGGTHEENPNGGVPMGIAPDNNPNLVEEGETIYNDYVFSNRINPDEAALKKFHIYSSGGNLTYADLSKRLEKEAKERPNDPISMDGLNAQLAKLAQEQERQKAEEEEKRARAAFEALSPQEQEMFLQEMARQQEAQAMQEQEAQEQAAQQEGQEGQEISPEEAEMQEEQVTPEQQEALEQQMMQEQAAANGEGMPQESYAYGGELHKFEDGGEKNVLTKPGISLMPIDFVDDATKRAAANSKRRAAVTWKDEARMRELYAPQPIYSIPEVAVTAPNLKTDHFFKAVNGKVFKSRQEAIQENNRIRRERSRGNVATKNKTAKPRTDVLDAVLNNAKSSYSIPKPTVAKAGDTTPKVNKANVQNTQKQQKTQSVQNTQKSQNVVNTQKQQNVVRQQKVAPKKVETPKVKEVKSKAYTYTPTSTSTSTSTPASTKPVVSTKPVAKATPVAAVKPTTSTTKPTSTPISTQPSTPTIAPAATSTPVVNNNISKHVGAWKNGWDEAKAWKAYAAPALERVLIDAEARLKGVTDPNERRRIQEDVANKFNGIQRSYADSWQSPSEAYSYNDKVKNHQVSWNQVGGNNNYYPGQGFGIADRINLPNGANTGDRYATWNDGIWGPITSTRNFGSTAYGNDDFYKPYIGEFNRLGFKFGANKDYSYNDGKNNLYTLSVKDDPELLKPVNPKTPEKIKVPNITVPNESTQTGKNNGPKQLPTWPRYFGIFGPMAALTMQALKIGKDPGSKAYERALSAVHGTGNPSPTHIGDYVRYTPYNLLQAQNMADATRLAGNRTIMNNSAPIGAKITGLIANDHNYYQGNGNLLRQAQEYNNKNMMDVATFNRGTNQFNAQVDNQFALAANQNKQWKAQALMNYAAQKAAQDQQWYEGLYNNVNNLFTNISNYGRENAAINQANSLDWSNVFGKHRANLGGIEQTSGNISAKGGKLKRKKRRGYTF